MAFTRSRGLFESTRVLFLPIHDIAPNPGQPRTRFSHESLEELADSIRTHGILQPLSVRRLSTSQYELISGERRLRAAEMAGLSHVPCILVKAGDLESSLLALVENLQRRDLDFVEEATALQKLIFIPACKIIAVFGGGCRFCDYGVFGGSLSCNLAAAVCFKAYSIIRCTAAAAV